ncbi:hypothetical protein ACUXV3_10970 [Roseobacteraceae bacterium NS-SX3]
MITLCELSSMPTRKEAESGDANTVTYRDEYLNFVNKIRQNQDHKQDAPASSAAGKNSSTSAMGRLAAAPH